MLKLPTLGDLDAGLGVHVYLCTSPTDMRKGFDTLAALVRESLGHDPLSGHLFLFAGRGKDRLKFLYWDSDGYLQADAFGGYDGIYAGEAGGRVTEVACWAHARRKFYDARNSDAAARTHALAHIRLLYDVEVEARRQAETLEAADAGSLPCATRAEAIRTLRQEKSVPRLAKFRGWLESQQASGGGAALPKNPMGQAITYALNQWDALNVYTTDGDLAVDNNAGENALRRVALGRKNWLFCGSDNGGKTAAVLFCLIATCQRHHIDPFTYLRDVLTRIAATPLDQLDQILPDRRAAARTTSNNLN